MIKFTNIHGVDVKIKESSFSFWKGEMTGYHTDDHVEFKVFDGNGYLLNDGFDTLEDARAYADTIEF